MTITATYPRGNPVTVWLRFGTCGALGASNGTRTGQRTWALVATVAALVGGSDDVPMSVAGP